MRFIRLVVGLMLALLTMPVRAGPVETALNDAIALFTPIQNAMGAEAFGVEVTAYGDALTQGQFTARHWGGPLALDLEVATSDSASCARFAAYVRLPPRDGVVSLVTCPQFSAEGTRDLRRLTILHEMVHVVAGPDECRAMAFAARVEHLATGQFTPVTRYWRANDCDGSSFTLP